MFEYSKEGKEIKVLAKAIKSNSVIFNFHSKNNNININNFIYKNSNSNNVGILNFLFRKVTLPMLAIDHLDGMFQYQKQPYVPHGLPNKL